MTLHDYLLVEMEKPFQLGTNDCAHFIARWVQKQTGKDPLLPFNGLPQELAQQLVLNGKLARSVALGCHSIGLKRTNNPRIGDVGVIRRPTVIQCAIMGKSGWIFFDEQGVGMMKNPRIIATWRVPCQPQ